MPRSSSVEIERDSPNKIHMTYPKLKGNNTSKKFIHKFSTNFNPTKSSPVRSNHQYNPQSYRKPATPLIKYDDLDSQTTIKD